MHGFFYYFYFLSVLEGYFDIVGTFFCFLQPGRVAQSVKHLTRKSKILGSIPGLATYFRFSFR